MKTPVFIRIYKDDQLVEVKQFSDPQVIVGSGDTAHLRLEDPSVAAIHLLIEERESGYFISDLGSPTGTFRNGVKVLDEKLNSGDQIQAGNYTLEFYQGVPKPRVAPPVGHNTELPTAKPSPPPTPVVVAPAPAPAPPAPPVAPVIPKAIPVIEPKAPTAAPPQEEAKKPTVEKKVAVPQLKALDEVLKPSRGSVVEVVTVWQDRVLNTYHFHERKTISVGGSTKDDIYLPIFGNTKTSYPLMRLDSQVMVFVRLDPGGLVRRENQSLTMTELMAQNRLVARSSGLYGIVLEQGEAIRVDFAHQISIYIRYVDAAPKPLLAPIADFSSSELTGFVMSFVLTAIFALYMVLYTPPPHNEDSKEDDVVRTAVFNMPELPKPKPPPVPPAPVEKETHPVVQDKKPTPVKAQTDKDQGKAAEAAPKPDKKKPKMLTSVQQGGEIKTSDKEGAALKTVQKKDVTKMGLLGVLGRGGAQNQLNQASAGAGELQGLANSATGSAGFKNDRPGEGLGSAIKDIGAGGNGTATVGIAGVGSGGKGFGKFGSGTGGLGAKTGTLVIPGGAEESFDTQIDKEAIRRVVRSHLREVQYCYEKELNQDPNLAGKVLVTWEIGPGGRVLSATVTSSSVSRKAVADCLVARLRTWRFPDPPSDKAPVVTYPFLFQKN